MSLIITSDKDISIGSDLKEKLQSITSLIFSDEGLFDKEINLRIVNDKEMQKLNHQFRNKNNTTNVLSFRSDDISTKLTKNIGDIAISSEYVEREAKDEEKTFEDHMKILWTRTACKNVSKQFLKDILDHPNRNLLL